MNQANKVDPTKEVPKLRRMSCRKAKKKIEEEGFKVGKVRYRTMDTEYRYVIKQTPKAGTRAPPGSAIDLLCSRPEED